jgi:hypothetical protein
MNDTITRVHNGIVRHLGGAPWYECPVPRRWHTCYVTSIAVLNVGDIIVYVERCPCGALKVIDLTGMGEDAQNTIVDVVELNGEVKNIRLVFASGQDHTQLPWKERNTRRTGHARFLTT